MSRSARSPRLVSTSTSMIVATQQPAKRGRWALAVALALIVAGCADATGPLDRIERVPEVLSTAIMSWSADVTPSGASGGGANAIATFPEARAVNITFSGLLTQTPAGGGDAFSFGPNGDPRYSCWGATNVFSNGTQNTWNGNYCSWGRQYETPIRFTNILVWGTVTAQRGYWVCETSGCPTYSGSHSVQVDLVTMTPELRRANDDGSFNPTRYVNHTYGWVHNTPWTLHSWMWYPEGGTAQNITSQCGSYYCSWNPAGPGMIVFDVTINGQRNQASHPVNKDAGNIELEADSVTTGSYVNFEATASPATVSGIPVELRDLKWTWTAEGLPPDTAVTSECRGATACRIRADNPGTMTVTGSYAGLAQRSDFEEVNTRRRGLSMSANPNPVMQGSSIAYAVHLTGDTAAFAVASNFRWEWTPDESDYSSSPPSCASADWTCLALQNHAGTMKVTAHVDGADTSATVHVDVWCLLNHPVLDDPRVRKLMEDAWDSTRTNLPPAQRRERTGHVWRDWQSGELITDLQIRNSSGMVGNVPYPADSPCSTDAASIDRGQRLLTFHTHPFQLGDTVPQAACGYTDGYIYTALRGPSNGDFNTVRTLGGEGMALDRDEIFLYPERVAPGDEVEVRDQNGQLVERSFLNKDLNARSWKRKGPGCVIFRT
jgi:hypothetical protein